MPVLWLPDATGKAVALAPLGPRVAGPRAAAPRRLRSATGGGAAAAASAAGPPAPGGRGAAGAGPGAAGGGAAGGGRGWQQPGPWKNPLTADDVVGAWIGFGTGVNKQYFIFRRMGNGLRGMVCGRCDNPFTLAALDDIEIDGDTLRFKILHDGWGDAPASRSTMGYRPDCRQRAARCFRNADGSWRPRCHRYSAERRCGDDADRPCPIEATTSNDSRPNR